MNVNRLKWLGFGGLLTLLVAIGYFAIPAHTISIWMDPEFTDWVSPIANRLHGSARLYADGMHSPMPPIPYVFMRMLYPHGAIWINESLLNYLFVSATVLSLFLVFARNSGPGLAFVACALAIPVFLRLPKTMLYDSMAQFLVVVVALFCARSVEALDPAGNAPSSRRLLWGLLTGAASGLLLLTKQSTGIGVVGAIIIVLAVLPAGKRSITARCPNIFVFLLAAVVTFFVVAAGMAKWISVPGMLHDVFLVGAEPKGGNKIVLLNLASFALAVGHRLALAIPVFWACSALLRKKLNWRTQVADLKETLNSTRAAKDLPLRTQGSAMFATMLLSVIGASAALWLPNSVGDTLFVSIGHTEYVRPFLLNLGFSACVLLMLWVIFSALGGFQNLLSDHPFAPLAIVFFFAAIFHNLSASGLRWTYDNNPLIPLAQIFLLGPIVGLSFSALRRPALWMAARIALLVAVIFYMWSAFFPQFKLILTCTESWPEIPHLAGARMRPDSENLRAMVKLVQAHADKSKHETVLLLPDDPNVEAWIDRDRPPVSSSILFTDQYWDRYVDSDIAALQKNPPKIIIIGPRGYWRTFSERWHKNTGLIRLINRVQAELLPARYELLKAQPISFEGRQEFMDVYIRRSP